VPQKKIINKRMPHQHFSSQMGSGSKTKESFLFLVVLQSNEAKIKIKKGEDEIKFQAYLLGLEIPCQADDRSSELSTLHLILP